MRVERGRSSSPQEKAMCDRHFQLTVNNVRFVGFPTTTGKDDAGGDSSGGSGGGTDGHGGGERGVRHSFRVW